MKIKNIDLIWLGHDGFLINNSKIIYIDPYHINNNVPKADIIFLTHGHYDHCSIEDLKKITSQKTKIIGPPDIQSKIMKFNLPIDLQIVEPGDELNFNNFKVNVFPAYNINKDFHKKEENLVGYIFKFKEVIIYHAGDTDKIPEMQKLTGFKQEGKTFIALLPVSGRYVMDAEEASNVAKLIKPDISIPMHWGSIIGNIEDAKEFKSLCEEEGIKVEILNKVENLS